MANSASMNDAGATALGQFVSLLPLLVALLSLLVARERTLRTLHALRGWLERHARTIAAVIIVLLAATLLRNGIVGLTS